MFSLRLNLYSMLKKILIAVILCVFKVSLAQVQTSPNREFRAA